MRSGNPALLILVLGIVEGLGCSNPPSAPENKDLGPPVILESRLVLDSSAKVGRMRLVARDPDGPVAIECAGAFDGVGQDSVVMSRPFADLRFDSYLITTCDASQGGSIASAITMVEEDEYPLDHAAVLVYPDEPTGLRKGVPSVWPVRATDDWALAEIWLAIAPGHYPDCTTNWTRLVTLVEAGRTVIDTTLTATFPTAGPHCVVIGAKDDLNRAGSYGYDVEVSP